MLLHPSRVSWSSTCSALAGRLSSLHCWPARPPTPRPYATCWGGCGTASPTTSPCRHSPVRSNLSERQFTRVFKSEVGVTAADHVEAVRVDSACRLLETTNRTIEQIARTCGFGTPETMHRTFRRRLNTTPGDYRHHFRGDISAPLP
ncbi:MAG TPA: helix-turn-helix domain-containing protein [Microlunatus sp.]